MHKSGRVACGSKMIKYVYWMLVYRMTFTEFVGKRDSDIKERSRKKGEWIIANAGKIHDKGRRIEARCASRRRMAGDADAVGGGRKKNQPQEKTVGGRKGKKRVQKEESGRK